MQKDRIVSLRYLDSTPQLLQRKETRARTKNCHPRGPANINQWLGGRRRACSSDDGLQRGREVGRDHKLFECMCGLRDIVLERHGSDAPRTHKRGSHPISAIFATHSVQCVQAGYAGFEDRVQSKRSDHCCLWFDVLINSIFGHEMPPTNKPQTRRLKRRLQI